MEERFFRGRHEIKLLISYADYLRMYSVISAALERDSHSVDGGYFIRSIYLDDDAETAYYQKAAGVDDRRKYRIRCYNLDRSFVVLECKEKRGQLVSKYSAVLDHTDAEKLAAGDFSVLSERQELACREIYSASKTRRLFSAAMVDYHREAFVYPVSDVRITFDKQLHSGICFNGLFDGSALTLPVFMNNSVILEVKYDTIFPSFIRSMIPFDLGEPISVSKYNLCRHLVKNIHS